MIKGSSVDSASVAPLWDVPLGRQSVRMPPSAINLGEFQ